MTSEENKLELVDHKKRKQKLKLDPMEVLAHVAVKY